MLPPIDFSTSDRNPRFKALWNDLSTTRLNPDGTSRVARKQKQQDDVRKVSNLCLSLETNTSRHQPIPGNDINFDVLAVIALTMQ